MTSYTNCKDLDHLLFQLHFADKSFRTAIHLYPKKRLPANVAGRRKNSS